MDGPAGVLLLQVYIQVARGHVTVLFLYNEQTRDDCKVHFIKKYQSLVVVDMKKIRVPPRLVAPQEIVLFLNANV